MNNAPRLLLCLMATMTCLACGGSTSGGRPLASSNVNIGDTCAAYARSYALLLDEDARICEAADPSTCAARRPVVVYEVPSGTFVDGTPPIQYASGISACPIAGSGVAVNPARTAALDAAFAAYVAAGCSAAAGPGCGAGVNPVTGTSPTAVAATCEQLQGDPGPRCH